MIYVKFLILSSLSEDLPLDIETSRFSGFT